MYNDQNNPVGYFTAVFGPLRDVCIDCVMRLGNAVHLPSCPRYRGESTEWTCRCFAWPTWPNDVYAEPLYCAVCDDMLPVLIAEAPWPQQPDTEPWGPWRDVAA